MSGTKQQPTITIILDEKGDIGVNGPLTNKLLCMGMLEMARHLILSYQPEQRVQLAPALPGLKGD